MDKLLHSITSDVWMIDQRAAANMVPFIASVLDGRPIAAYKETPQAHTYGVDVDTNMADGTVGKSLVAVHQIHGVVTKYSQYCGPRGTLGLMEDLRVADNDSEITAHVLSLDTPGGQGSNINTVSRFIRNDIKKPVIAFVSSRAASAGYGIAAACDAIYCEESSNIVGSVGVYSTLMDFRGQLEQRGIKLIEVYASDSTEKNKDYRDALDGDIEGFRETHINPLAEEFIATVKAHRPQIEDDGKVFAGKAYPAAAALSLGLIDGIATFEEVIAKAAEMGGTGNTNSISMKNLNTALDTNLQTDKQGGVYLNAEQVTALNAALEGDSPAPVVDDSVEKELKAENETLNAKLAELTERTAALEERTASLEDWKEQRRTITAAAPETKPAAEAKDEVEKSEYQQAMDKLNKQYGR